MVLKEKYVPLCIDVQKLITNIWKIMITKMSQKLPVNGFNWVENTSQFNEDFIKSYDKSSDEGSFLWFYVQYP